MDNILQKHEDIQIMCQNLARLEPFFRNMETLEKDAAYLAESMNKVLHISKILLIRLNGRGEISDKAYWGYKSLSDISFDRFAENYFPEISRRVREGIPVGEKELDDMFGTVYAESCKDLYFTLSAVHFGETAMGFVIFGKDRAYGTWNEEEKHILSSFTGIMGISFANKGFQDENALSTWVFNAVMDKMNCNLYITDPATDKILFMNKAMRETFQVENPLGEICWKVLQNGMDRRCEFCPVQTLLKQHGKAQDKTASCIWEEKNTLTGRVYENYDSLMQWMDGSMVHFQQSIDITDTKMLTRAASFDDLTSMLNRRAGRERLEKTMEEARRRKESIVVGMYDVNDLKEVNDTYGHREGDTLLRTIANAVMQELTADDFPFRLSGDEFIVVFRNKNEDAAAAIIAGVRQVLSQQSRELDYECGFCCGLITVKPGDGLSVQEVLLRVDEKMYEKKRIYHIEKAEKKAANGGIPDTAENFAYDRERLYQALVQSTEDYIYVCNMKTGVFRYPKAMVEEFELPGEVIANAAAVWGARIHPHDKKAFMESNQEIADGRTDCHKVEYRAMNRHGEWVWLRCQGHLERDEKGEPVLFAGMISNLGKKRTVDPITGLLNKYELEKEVDNRIAMNPDLEIILMAVGLDNFKNINDLYSREFGDRVLRSAAQKIQAILPPEAGLYHLDGDEFCVVTVDLPRQEVRRIYQEIRLAFSSQQQIDGKKYFCTISAGCAEYPRNAAGYSNLRKYAEYSLDYSKKQGKDRITFFSRKIMEKKSRQLDMIEQIRESVEKGFKDFTLVYQPLVNADTGEVKGAEALARWRYKGEPVSPGEFIPLLESSGLIHPVGKWIFKTAVDTCFQWVKQLPDFTMNINLSYVQLSDLKFIDFMRDTIAESGIKPLSILVELTESSVMSDVESIRRIFRKIRRLGIGIAMDDFGTGYSSLGILKNNPSDIVKIDRAFVKDILSSSFDAAFIRFVVELCHDANIDVCLEGVETNEEYGLVKDMQLDYIQGYLFGRPVPREEFERKYIYDNRIE